MKISIAKLHPTYFACIIFCLCHAAPAKPQDKPEMTEYIQEFFLGETVFAQERNEVQFTLKPFSTKNEQRQVLIPLSIEYGFTDRLQMEIEVPYLFSSVTYQKSVRGIGNAEVGLMYTVLKANRPFSLSVGINKSLQTARKQTRLYYEETSWEAFTVAGRQIGKGQLHANVHMENTDGKITLNYGIGSLYNFGRCSATFEVTSENDEERAYYVTPGVIWRQPHGFEFGMAVAKSIHPSATDWSVVAMLVFEFSLFSKKN